MSDHPSHPFRYFGLLPVSRDPDAIKRAVEAMYQVKVKVQNHATRFIEYHTFTENVLLIAKTAPGGRPGTYVADMEKVEAIIQRSLQPLEEYFLGLVNPHSNSIHPIQIDKCIAVGEKTFGVASSVTRPFLDHIVKSHNISIRVDPPPRGPRKLPKCVENFRAEARDGEVRLLWKLPDADFYDRIKIVRVNGTTPSIKDAGEEVNGSQWTDTKVLPGQRYTYGVFSALGSESVGPELVTIQARGHVEDFQVRWDASKVKLRWKPLSNTERVLVFRSDRFLSDLVDEQGRLSISAGAQQVHDLEPVCECDDTPPDEGQTYHYATVVRHGQNCYSPSECRSITAPKTPPDPPGLKAEVVGAGHVYLSWQPVRGFGECSYRILRQEIRAKEVGPLTVRKEIKSTTFDDDSVQPGTTYRYKLQTLAGGLESAALATSSPLTATGEVEDLVVAAHEGQVRLVWTPPPGVRRIEIRRKQAAPPFPPEKPGDKPTDVELYIPRESGSFVDFAVTNGMTYGYRISCVFLTADGKEVVTRGKTDSAIPRKIPNAVFSPKVESFKGGAVRLCWDNPNGATVAVIRAGHNPGLSTAAVQPISALHKLGTPLTGVTSREIIDPAPSFQNQPFYLIFSVDSFLAVYSGLVQLVELDGVRVSEEDGNVLLQWNWPGNALGVRVTRKASPAEASELFRSCENDKSGSAKYLAESLGPGTHVFHIQALVSAEDKTLMAGPGTTVSTRIVQVEHINWHIRRHKKGVFLKSEELQLIVEGNRGLQRVQRLMLVGRVNRCPETAEDGTFRIAWEPKRGQGGVESTLLPKWKSSYGRVFCRLFAEPADAVRITHPPATECGL